MNDAQHAYRYMNVHEHVEAEGLNMMGLGQLQVTFGSHKIRTRHLDYVPRRRLSNGTLVEIEYDECSKGEYERIYNDISKWPRYLTVLEIYWTNRSVFTDSVVSSRHSVPTTDMSRLIEIMELEQTYGLRDPQENYPVVPVVGDFHAEYNVFMHKLTSPPELSKDNKVRGLWNLRNVSSVMSTIRGMTGASFYTQRPRYLSSYPEDKVSFPFFDSLRQIYVANASGAPNIRTIANQTYSIAFPLEVVYLNPTIRYNPCNSTGPPPYRLRPCNSTIPIINGHSLHHRSTEDVLRFPLLKPVHYNQHSEEEHDDNSLEQLLIIISLVLSSILMIVLVFLVYVLKQNGIGLKFPEYGFKKSGFSTLM